MKKHKTHDLRIDFIDFGLYHLRIRSDVYMKPNDKISVGDNLRLFEYDKMSQVLTGRSLTCQVGLIDKNPQLVKSLKYWLISVIWLPELKSLQSS